MDRHSAFIQQGYIREIITVIEQLTDISPYGALGIKSGIIAPSTSSVHFQSARLTIFWTPLAYEQLALPHLGLLVGTRWSLMCHGLASMAAMTQETYGDSLATATRLHDQLFPAITMELIAKKDVLELKSLKMFPLLPTDVLHQKPSRAISTISHYLLGSEVEPGLFRFRYNARPVTTTTTSAFSRCPIRFDAENVFAVSKPRACPEIGKIYTQRNWRKNLH